MESSAEAGNDGSPGPRSNRPLESLQFRNGATLKFMSGGGSDKSRAGFTSRVVVITETDGMDKPGATIPDSNVPWEYRVGKPDVDHFNRDYKPQESRGGVSICRLDPKTSEIMELTPARSATWDFRASESSDGKEVAFCRAETGECPALWVMDSKGMNPRQIAKGIDNKGVDHPRWLPVKK